MIAIIAAALPPPRLVELYIEFANILTALVIGVIRTLYMRGAFGAPVSLSSRLRFAVAALWRRELVQIWHRLAPDRGSEGPYYSLTFSGQQLAAALVNRAPRRFSGAGQSS